MHHSDCYRAFLMLETTIRRLVKLTRREELAVVKLNKINFKKQNNPFLNIKNFDDRYYTCMKLFPMLP